MDEYFSKVTVYLSFMKNFVDFEQVKDEPIERVIKLFQGFQIDLDNPLLRLHKFIETRVSLLDNIMQFFVEPVEFFHLNLSEQWTTSDLPALFALT